MLSAMHPEAAARAKVAQVEESSRLFAEYARLRHVCPETLAKMKAVESNLKGASHGG